MSITDITNSTTVADRGLEEAGGNHTTWTISWSKTITAGLLNRFATPHGGYGSDRAHCWDEMDGRHRNDGTGLFKSITAGHQPRRVAHLRLILRAQPGQMHS
jgi:hypothetical protein